MFKKTISFIAICLLLFFNCAQCFTSAQCPPNEVYFNKTALDPIIAMIESAKSTIDIQMFSFTNYEKIISALKNSAQSGAKIRIYVDNQDSNNPNKKDKNGKILGLPEKELEDLGIQIKWETSGKYMHRKLAIFDSKRFIIGSTNWTKNGIESNDEVDIVMSDSHIICLLEQQFQKDWEKANLNFK